MTITGIRTPRHCQHGVAGALGAVAVEAGFSVEADPDGGRQGLWLSLVWVSLVARACMRRGFRDHIIRHGFVGMPWRGARSA